MNGNYTNYSLAIQAAMAQLQTIQTSRPGAQNVIVLLSDGDAAYNPGGAYATPYPCNNGISSAETAADPTKLHVTFFSIAYGANSSANSSCSLDNARGARPPLTGVSALCAMKLMAANFVSDPKTATNPDGYTSDQDAYTQLCTNGGSPSNNHFFNVDLGNSLEGVFEQIGSSLVTPRLIGNDAE